VGLIHRITRRPLSDFVDFLWLSEGYAQPHAAEHVLPAANMSLVINLDARDPSRDVLSGARTRALILDTSKPLSLMGVCFKPGGGFPLFDGPAVELQDLSVSLETLWGASAAALLRERLLEANRAAAKFRILERFLVDRVRAASDPHPAVKYALAAFGKRAGAASVAAVTERTGFSARRFIALFRNEVGLTPKVYCRLARFREVVVTLTTTSRVDWTEIALASGYYDQPHFNHDFREFAGMSPSDYLRHRTSSPNHVRRPG
jgi:methylphosphotriester-DNA--protein-cysteine methyltransferase